MDGVLFACVLCAVLLSFSYRKTVSKTDALLLRLAMIATLSADYCLLILYRDEAGVLLFCIVQFLYIIRYAGAKAAFTIGFGAGTLYALLCGISSPYALSLFGGFVNPNGVALDVRTKIAAVYGVLLLGAVTAACFAYAKKRYPKPAAYCVLVGSLLFLGCDIQVMLYNLPLPAAWHNVLFIGIWVCYLPSQFLLAHSAKAPLTPPADQPPRANCR